MVGHGRCLKIANAEAVVTGQIDALSLAETDSVCLGCAFLYTGNLRNHQPANANSEDPSSFCSMKAAD